MVVRQHQCVLPNVAGQGNQFIKVSQRLGGDADFGDFVNQHPRHLRRGRLVQAHIDFGKLLAQPRHEFGQHVAGLGVGGGDGQRAAVLLAELFSDPPQVAHLAQDHVNAFEYVLAGLGHPLESLSVPRKDLDTQFTFQLQYGFGHAGL